MDWEFTEDAAFLALCDAFRESGESSAIEFLANGEGAFHFQDLAQNAAGEGLDLSESNALESFQQEVIDTMESSARTEPGRGCVSVSRRSSVEESDLLVLQTVPSGLLEPLIERFLVEMLGSCLDDPVPHRFQNTTAGTLTFQIHYLGVKSEHRFRDWTSIEIDTRFDGGIDTIRSGNGHGQ